MNATVNRSYRGVRAVLSAGVVACLALLGGCQGTDGDAEARGNSGVTGKYVGAQTCVTCHSRHHDNWAETAHAGALETLEAIGQDKNPVCLGCHTVGFGQPGGFVDRATTDALAGVQCESCHGPARDHATNVTDESKRPIVSMSATICMDCHTGSHHPTAEEWSMSGHVLVTGIVAGNFAGGVNVNRCGVCHSGDARYAMMQAEKSGEPVPDTLLAGVPYEELNAVSCAVCHNPHQRTGNAAAPPEGRDYQLRFREVVNTTASNDVDEVQDPGRFNLCGQCHHSRGGTWQLTSRGPHHSVQTNVYIGEMPIPDGTALLVDNERSIHSFVPKQCATCHMRDREFVSEEIPAITGHSFHIDTAGCLASNCHPNQQTVNADLDALQSEVATRLDAIAARLGNPGNWEYTSGGGPDSAGQALLSDEIKQIRFLYYYITEDGSLGVHNPQYVDAMLDKAEALLTGLGL